MFLRFLSPTRISIAAAAVKLQLYHSMHGSAMQWSGRWSRFLLDTLFSTTQILNPIYAEDKVGYLTKPVTSPTLPNIIDIGVLGLLTIWMKPTVLWLFFRFFQHPQLELRPIWWLVAQTTRSRQRSAFWSLIVPHKFLLLLSPKPKNLSAHAGFSSQMEKLE